MGFEYCNNINGGMGDEENPGDVKDLFTLEPFLDKYLHHSSIRYFTGLFRFKSLLVT